MSAYWSCWIFFEKDEYEDAINNFDGSHGDATTIAYTYERILALYFFLLLI